MDKYKHISTAEKCITYIIFNKIPEELLKNEKETQREEHERVQLYSTHDNT